jgi:hypothetical protein
MPPRSGRGAKQVRLWNLAGKALQAVPGKTVSRSALAPGSLALRHAGPGELLGEGQQWIRGASYHLASDVGDPLASAARDGSELLECLSRPDSVPLGQYPDRLLDPDPDRQGTFQLADRGPKPPCLIVAASVTSGGVTYGAIGSPRTRHGVAGPPGSAFTAGSAFTGGSAFTAGSGFTGGSAFTAGSGFTGGSAPGRGGGT